MSFPKVSDVYAIMCMMKSVHLIVLHCYEWKLQDHQENCHQINIFFLSLFYPLKDDCLLDNRVGYSADFGND